MLQDVKVSNVFLNVYLDSNYNNLFADPVSDVSDNRVSTVLSFSNKFKKINTKELQFRVKIIVYKYINKYLK